MGGQRNSHMLTYQTTRPIKCIYFDGESAALMGTGQLDTQMLHIFSNVSGPDPPDGGFRGLHDEYARAKGLCDWIQENQLGGNGWGVEGIVRMNVGFEMIWCDFQSRSLRLLSHLNITAPLLPDDGDDENKEKSDRTEGEQQRQEHQPEDWLEAMRESRAIPTSYYPLPPLPTKTERSEAPSNPPLPPNWRRDWEREPFRRSQSWSWFSSATQHYGSFGYGSGVGENRVKILSCGFLSYYAPKVTTAATFRAAKEQHYLNLTVDGLWSGPGTNGTRLDGLTALTRRRRAHTLSGVSSEDAIVMRRDSEEILLNLLSNLGNCSGMDWTTVANEIVQTYAADLFTFLKTLQTFNSITKKNETALQEWIGKVRDQTHLFLIPFFQYPQEPSKADYKRGSIIFSETFSRCRYHYTRLLDPVLGISLNPQEQNLRWAVEETMSNICFVLIDVGLSIEEKWFSNFNVPSSSSISQSTFSDVKDEVTRWTEGVEELMAWLGWAGEWTSCDRKCEWDEKCFIPMWPLLHWNFGGPGRRRPPPKGEKPGDGDPDRKPPRDGKPPSDKPPGGGFRWQPDESDLWQPKCVKDDWF
jgi:hypothetical protein